MNFWRGYLFKFAEHYRKPDDNEIRVYSLALQLKTIVLIKITLYVIPLSKESKEFISQIYCNIRHGTECGTICDNFLASGNFHTV